MRFWAYLLHCRGGVFYVGHTDDLERRIAQHQHGEIAGFSQKYLPAVLVWSQAFQTRDDAKAAEKRIKGWSRAKKLALIRGDWDRISQLAKGKEGKSDPSTSSGETEVEDGEDEADQTGMDKPASKPVDPELVEGSLFLLLPHPEKPPLGVTSVRARITAITDHWLTLRWNIAGARRVALPALAGKHRVDGLWRHTCFEMFLQIPGDDAYLELNLSPSEGWAAYHFTGYRQGMTQHPMPRQPDCIATIGGDTLIFDAAVPLAGLPPLPWRAGLTAVIEEQGGVMSYWALAHAPGPPDFHNPACRALTVPAPPLP